MQLWQTVISSPLGSLRALCSAKGLFWLAFQEVDESLDKLPACIARYFPKAYLENTAHPFFELVERWVSTYFSAGGLFPNLPPLDLQGTEFSNKLWLTLQSSVRLGEVKSYGWLAVQLNHTKAVRAVGRSLGENPIALIIPCHRIIGANGSLTGYRGGLWRKKWLLDHEKKAQGLAISQSTP